MPSVLPANERPPSHPHSHSHPRPQRQTALGFGSGPFAVCDHPAMVPKTPATPAPGQRPDAAGTPLPVAEAAHRLGVTPDAVRKKLQRGTLPGEKVAGEWRVFLPEPDAGQDSRQDATETRQDTARTGIGAVLEGRDALIDQLRSENAFLREQLDHSRRELAGERGRFDVIHREALHRIEALTAGDADAGEPRQDARVEPSGPRRGGEGVDRPAGEGGSWVAHLWRRVRGSG